MGDVEITRGTMVRCSHSFAESKSGITYAQTLDLTETLATIAAENRAPSLEDTR